MADIFESRCESESFDRSDWVLRVACIGDSMMYGQGVFPRSTLPAQLSRFLNAAFTDDLVWVDNFGESSGNLWHAWGNLRSCLRYKRFDALVFSVCQNDSFIFESNTVRYPDEPIAYWRASLARVHELFADVADVCRRENIVPTIVYYSFVEADTPIVELLKPLLAELSLPMVDMLAAYRDQTGINAASYRASEFDGHPSGLAHELTARLLTRELQQALKGKETGHFSREPRGTLNGALGDLIGQRVPVDTALLWAGEALATKRTAMQRRVLGENFALPKLLQELEKDVETCSRRWCQARLIEATVLSGRLPSGVAVDVSQIFAAVRNLNEAALLIERASDVDTLRALASLFPPGDYYDQLGRLDFFQSDVGTQLAIARERLGRLRFFKPVTAENLIDCGAMLRNSLDPAAAAGDLAGAFLAAKRFIDLLDRLEVAGRRLGLRTSDSNVAKLWAITFVSVFSLVSYLEQFDQMLATHISHGSFSALTKVEVLLEGGADPDVAGNVCALTVEAEYDVPRRRRIREMLWAGVSKERARYQFEIPQMFLGTLTVGVREHEPTRKRFLNGTTRIAEIEVYGVTANGRPTAPPSRQSRFIWKNLGNEKVPLVELNNVTLL